MLRRLGILGLVLAGLALALWASALGWANSGRLETLLEVEFLAATGFRVEITGLRVGPLLGLGAAEVVVRDPAGGPFLALSQARADWRLPWQAGAAVLVEASGGRVDLNREVWADYRPGAPARPTTGGPGPAPQGLPRLAAEGTIAVDDRELVEIAWEGIDGRLTSALHGLDLPYRQAHGRLTLSASGAFRAREVAVLVGPSIPLELGLSGRGEAVELEIRLAPPRLGELLNIPPWGIQAMALGLVGEGAATLVARLRLSRDQLVAMEGTLDLEGSAIRIGGERLLGPLTGRWTFEGGGDGARGELVLRTAGLQVHGLPLVFEAVEGRLELGVGRARLARAKARSRLGAARIAWTASWAEQAPGWELVVEAGGKAGWLKIGTLVAGPAGIVVRGVHIGGEAGEFELAAELAPGGVEPPTWELSALEATGTLKGGTRIGFQGLAGSFYLDEQGGYSFSTRGVSGALAGQLATDGSLKLWATPADGAQQVAAWGPPTRE